jgi:hypothetical protein
MKDFEEYWLRVNYGNPMYAELDRDQNSWGTKKKVAFLAWEEATNMAKNREAILIVANELHTEQNKKLEEIAYCASGFFESENERNFGDAEQWKQKLEQRTDAFYDAKYRKSEGIS